MGYGLALFVRSQFAKSESKLEKIYISELGLDGSGRGGAGPLAGGDDDDSPRASVVN
jgi:hypothetical protein